MTYIEGFVAAVPKANKETYRQHAIKAAPVFEAGRASTAIFYSINNTQARLRGVSFGNVLLKRVIDDLQRDFPRLRTFATLSPIPGLVAWAGRRPAETAA